MIVNVGLNVMVEVEIDDKFKVLDVPSIYNIDVPESLYLDCAICAKKEVEKIYPYYKDLDVFGVYSVNTDNALAEF